MLLHLNLRSSNEVAVQTTNVLIKMATYTQIRIGSVLKDANGILEFFFQIQIQFINECLISVNLSAKMDCHVVVGTPKELVSFKIMRIFNIEKITLCVFDDADTIITTKFVKDHVVKNSCRKILVSSNINKLDIGFMVPYDVHNDPTPMNVIQSYASCPSNCDKLQAILCAYEHRESFSVR